MTFPEIRKSTKVVELKFVGQLVHMLWKLGLFLSNVFFVIVSKVVVSWFRIAMTFLTLVLLSSSL